jgi:outer membrane protein OmpA-like peptidoglycan-associated protein
MITGNVPARRDTRQHSIRGAAAVAVALTALACLALAPALAFAVPITLAYPWFLSDAMEGFQVNPAAYQTGGVVRLTDLSEYQSGSFFTKQRVELDASRSFSTFFTMRMYDGTADGMCFVIQESAADALGSDGGYLGYGGIPGGSMAIEFDTWDGGEDFGDTDSNHIGVDINGSVVSTATAPPPGGADLRETLWHVWVDYDGLTHALEVRMATGDSRPTDPTLEYPLDLATVIGTDVFVGFTGGTGLEYQCQEVASFYFNNALMSDGVAPGVEGPPTYEGGPASIEGTVTPPIVAAGSTTRTSVRFLDPAGQPMADQPVTFSAPVGTLLATTAITDHHGVASVLYTPPATAGVYVVRAEAVGGLFVDLEVGVTPGSLVHFRPYSARLTPAARRLLKSYAAMVAASGATGVRIEAHTARRMPGSLRSRTMLSKARANAIRRFLMVEFRRRHVAPAIYLSWFGGTRPLANNDTRFGTALNRRAELLLLMPPAGVPTFPPVIPLPQ